MTDPTAFTQPGPPADKKGLSKGCIMGIVITSVIGLVGVVVLVVAGVFFVQFGMDVIADQVKREIQDNPVILEQVGEIRTMEMDMVASANEPGDQTFVFKLDGAKGTGTLTVSTVTIDGFTEQVTWGQLRVESGETYDLLPDQAPHPN
jgi:uncharacterized protein YneF (UPF0154 family)